MQTHPAYKKAELTDFSPVRNKPTRARYVILILLFFITAINYIDRASVSIAAPSIQTSLNISLHSGENRPDQ
jgi:ACS family D-galactonate transporter-like MFS transporter